MFPYLVFIIIFIFFYHSHVNNDRTCEIPWNSRTIIVVIFSMTYGVDYRRLQWARLVTSWANRRLCEAKYVFTVVLMYFDGFRWHHCYMYSYLNRFCRITIVIFVFVPVSVSSGATGTCNCCPYRTVRDLWEAILLLQKPLLLFTPEFAKRLSPSIVRFHRRRNRFFSLPLFVQHPRNMACATLKRSLDFEPPMCRPTKRQRCTPMSISPSSSPPNSSRSEYVSPHFGGDVVPKITAGKSNGHRHQLMLPPPREHCAAELTTRFAIHTKWPCQHTMLLSKYLLNTLVGLHRVLRRIDLSALLSFIWTCQHINWLISYFIGHKCVNFVLFYVYPLKQPFEINGFYLGLFVKCGFM